MLCLWGSWAAQPWHGVPVTVVAFLPRYVLPLPNMQSAGKEDGGVCARVGPGRAGAGGRLGFSNDRHCGPVLRASDAKARSTRCPSNSLRETPVGVELVVVWRGVRVGILAGAPGSSIFYKQSGKTEHPAGAREAEAASDCWVTLMVTKGGKEESGSGGFY